jgi:uncharacterized membrane protein
MAKKISVAFFLFLFGMSFLSAQSLAAASKKEKERRAAFKGKQTVVTNEDLGKTKKKAAMTESVPEKPAEEAVVGEAEGEVPPEGEQAPAEETAPVESTPGEAPPAAVDTPSEAAPPAAEGEPTLSQEEFGRRQAELEDAWNKAQEMVELLTMKMNGLWQEFYNLDDMTSRDKIQQQISETYEKLLKTQQDEIKAREELDAFIAKTPREGVPQLWIR